MNKKTKIVIAIALALVVLACVCSLCNRNTTISDEKIATIDEVTTVDEVELTTVATTVATESTEITTTVSFIPSPEVVIGTNDEYSDYELDLLARTIYQESGICGEYCQWLVGSTVLNLADERGGIENVVFDYNTFNVAYILYDCTPSDLSYSVAERLMSGDRDYNVKAFRSDYYHDFGTPYTYVDNMYFSVY